MKTAAIILAITCVSTIAFANDSLYGTDHMDPYDFEKLPSPFKLNGPCACVRIVEWRGTLGYENSTSLNISSVKILNEVCELSVNNFKRFVVNNGYIIQTSEKFSQSVSLIPADIHRHGFDVRNLNDSVFRFASRYGEYDENGKIIPIWGYHSQVIAHIFIRNDVLDDDGRENYRFKTIFAHELFHAMSYQYGIFQQHSGNKTEIDELMARKFTRFLRIGE